MLSVKHKFGIITMLLFASLLLGCTPKSVPGPSEVEAICDRIDVVLPADTAQAIDRVAKMELVLGKILDTSDPQIINNATMAFIRKDLYGYELTGMSGSVWGQFAGTLMKECGVDITDTAVLEKYGDVIFLAEQQWAFTDPFEGATIDFVHMITVMDIEYTEVSELPYQETYYDVLMTWGGDLETFLIDIDAFAQANPGAKTEQLNAYAMDLLGSDKPSYFSREDLLADVDGRNMGLMLKGSDRLVSEVLLAYYARSSVVGKTNVTDTDSALVTYTGPVTATCDRAKSFVYSYGGQVAFEELVDGFLTYKMESQYAGDQGVAEFMVKFKIMKKIMLAAVPEYTGDYGEEFCKVVRKAFVTKFRDR